MEIFKLFGSIVIKDEEALKKLDYIDKKGQGVGKTFDKMRQTGEKITSVGKKLTVGVTAPIVALGVASGKMASDFGVQMANVTTLLNGSAQEAKNRSSELGKSVLKLSKDTGVATETLTGGLYEVVSAFGDTADSAKILETATKAAKAGGAEVSDSVKLLSAVTKGYGDTSAEANQKASDLAFTTVKLGQTTFPELAASVGKVIPLASALGVQQEELFGVMATGTGVTGTASEVTTQLRGVIQALMSPTKDMTALMGKLGYSNGEAMIKSLGLQGTIDAITKAANDSGQPLQKYISSIEGQTLAMALSGAQSDVLKEKTKAMYEATGATNDAFERASDVAGAKWSKALNSVKITMISLGDAFAPIIEKIAEFILKITDFIFKLNEVNPSMRNLILVFAGLLAAIGPVLIIIGSLIAFVGKVGFAFTTLSPIIASAGGMMSFLTGGIAGVIGALGSVLVPIIAVVGALGIFVAALVKAYNENESFRNKVNEVFNQIKSIISNVMAIVKDIISMTWSLIKTIWNNGLSQILGVCGSILVSIVGVFTSKLNSVTSIVRTVISLVKAIFSGDFRGVISIVTGILSSVVNGFKSKMDNAKNVVKSAIDKIKGFFNFSWSLPKIKLPHFSVSGSKNPIDWISQGVPKFSVEWYKNGGIMTKPTMFGINGNSAMVGGEAGPEAILPISNLREYVREEMDGVMKSYNNSIDYNKMTQSFVTAIQSLGIKFNVDGKAVAQAIVGYSDNINGNRLNLTERGIVL